MKCRPAKWFHLERVCSERKISICLTNGYLHKKEDYFRRISYFGQEMVLSGGILYEDEINVPNEFEIIDFQGGLNAVATDIDQKTDKELINTEIISF